MDGCGAGQRGVFHLDAFRRVWHGVIQLTANGSRDTISSGLLLLFNYSPNAAAENMSVS